MVIILEYSFLDHFEWRTIINILELFIDTFGPNGPAVS